MIIDFLIERFKEHRDKEAVIHNDKVYTYSDLLASYEEWLETIRENNVKPGQVVALEGDFSLRTCAAILSFIENRNIIVPLTTVTEVQKEEYIKISGVDILFNTTDNNASVRTYTGNRKNELINRLVELNAPGLILFTSGSTGNPKGVVHNFAKMLERYKKKREPFRTMTLMLLDHLGGIDTLFHGISSGGTIITTSSRKPEDICRIVEKHKVELLPASPSFLNLLILSELHKKYDLSSLKKISYGSEVMPESTFYKLQEIFPNVQLRQSYALSEMGVLRTKIKSADSLWLKVEGEGFQTKIVDGILYIKAESAMLGYINAPNPFDEEGWFNTQDEVITDGDYIRILGRKSEIINVGGQKVFPAEVETVILQMPGIKDVVVKGEESVLMGNIVTAKVVLQEEEDLHSLKRRIREYCQGKLEPFKIPVKVEISKEDLFNARFKRIRK